MPEAAQPPKPAELVAQREWPPLRAAILDVAAAMDRLDRAEACDTRANAQSLLAQLMEPGAADRAERLLTELSRGYDPAWQERFAAGQTNADLTDKPA